MQNGKNTIQDETGSPLALSGFYVARQPIFDRDLNVTAYELLFRAHGDTNAYLGDGVDGDGATAQVLTATSELGIRKLTGNVPAFVNVPKRFIVEPELIQQSPSELVLELLETVEPSPAVLDGMRALAKQGFKLALDDFVYSPAYDPALEIADLVKLDIHLISPDRWDEQIARLQQYNVKILAEKVETEEQFVRLRDLGCHYFQGYFFARPNIVTGQGLRAHKLSMLELLSEINDPEADIDHIAELASRDITVAVRALRHVNSAAYALEHHIDSVREAIIYLGRDTIRNWVTLYLMFSIDGKPGELINMALIRARFCELLAREISKEDAGRCYTVGLLSVLDALLDDTMDHILESLSLQEELHAALTDYTGPCGEALRMAIAMERQESLIPPFDHVPPSRLAHLYIEAMQWANDTVAIAAN